MKIAFNFHATGAGNNGGTRTVFLSAITLSKLGHSVEIWSDSSSRFTWFPLPPAVPFVVRSDIAQHSPVDILVATGSASVDSTVRFRGKRSGWYWIRRIETDAEEEFVRGCRSGLTLAVNATWMVDWVRRRAGVDCHLVRPGVETDFFVPGDRRVEPVGIGALYSPKSRKRFADVQRVVERLRKSRKGRFSLSLLSNESDAPAGADAVFVRPTEENKREMYQSVGIWFAPTENEGLHVPPMEAGLCGCALVAHGMPSAGMGDYAIHERTALVYGERDADAAYEMVLRLVDSPAERARLGAALRQKVVYDIGTREDNMRKFAELMARA